VSLQEARNAFEAASRDLEQVQQRFKDHLATNQELSLAQQALQTARLRLETLTSRGVGQSQRLKAGVVGLLSKIDVQEGQLVPAGGALLEVAEGNRMEVQLGVEPQDAHTLQPDQQVQIVRVEGTAATTQPMEGKVRVVGQRVDPTSRLVNVLVSIPQDASVLLDSFVTGRITRATTQALVVPRDAALPEEGGKHVVYTVSDGHAKKHEVSLGLQNDDEVQVIADDLKAGDVVVVTGNYPLQDGMDVEIAEATTQPATAPAPEPAAAPAASSAETKP
jgi:membrane fusion protein, multidrug efflux system